MMAPAAVDERGDVFVSSEGAHVDALVTDGASSERCEEDRAAEA